VIEQTDQFQKFVKTLARKYEFKKIKKSYLNKKICIFYLKNHNFSNPDFWVSFYCLEMLKFPALSRTSPEVWKPRNYLQHKPVGDVVRSLMTIGNALFNIFSYRACKLRYVKLSCFNI